MRRSSISVTTTDRSRRAVSSIGCSLKSAARTSRPERMRMFLRNYWYVAAWNDEVSREPLARTVLGEDIVLFRKRDGTVVALENRCAHRRLPLSVGRIVDDSIECGYHG